MTNTQTCSECQGTAIRYDNEWHMVERNAAGLITVAAFIENGQITDTPTTAAVFVCAECWATEKLD